MEKQSWLQQQAALSKFDGYRDSEPFSKVKVTAAPAPTACSAAPEAGRTGDIVYDPQDAAADWSGFAPRNCAGRRMHDGGLPAAHQEVCHRPGNSPPSRQSLRKLKCLNSVCDSRHYSLLLILARLPNYRTHIGARADDSAVGGTRHRPRTRGRDRRLSQDAKEDHRRACAGTCSLSPSARRTKIAPFGTGPPPTRRQMT